MLQTIFPLPSVEDPDAASTLGEYIAVGYQVRARCTHAGCNHNVNLNLVVVHVISARATVRNRKILSHISIAHLVVNQDLLTTI